jgi:hypothetical protein
MPRFGTGLASIASGVVFLNRQAMRTSAIPAFYAAIRPQGDACR